MLYRHPNRYLQSTFVDNGTEDPRWSSYPAPGADDDLSGSGMVLEVFRTLVSLGFRPDRTLEFMAFSGEERGIYDGTIHGKTGSELIARHYRSEGRQVVAMLNFDSIGSPFNSTESDGCNPLGASDGGIGVFADPIIDASIRDLAASCVDIYSEEPYFALLGPNGNSDHMSFIGKSYPAGGMVEANIAANGLDLCGFDRQRHHTPSDTVDHVDFDYVKQFARVAMAFVIEASFAPDRAQDPNVAIDYDPTRCSSASRLSSDSVSILFSLFVAVWMW
jgi:leucyl aminopeptidase